MRTATRDIQRYNNTNLVNDISVKLSFTLDKLRLIQTHISSLINTSTTPSEKKTTSTTKKCTSESRGAYWRDTADTLSRENSELMERLSRVEDENRSMKQRVENLILAKRKLEHDLSTAEEELKHISMTQNLTTTRHGMQISIPPKSTFTKEKDAIFWYQRCRSIESQLSHRIFELENRISELSNSLSTKRKRVAPRE